MLRMPLLSFLLLTCAATHGLAQESAREVFDAKLYAIEQLTHFSSSRERFRSTIDVGTASVLEARSVVMDFLRDVDRNQDARQYLTPALAKTFASGDALAKGVIDQETVLIAAGVSNYDVKNDASIQFSVFVVAHSEGTFVLSEMEAVVRRMGKSWKIDSFTIKK